MIILVASRFNNFRLLDCSSQFLLESSGDALSDEQQSLLRLAKHNLVVVNLLASGHLPDAKILFDRGHHLYFPLLRLA